MTIKAIFSNYMRNLVLALILSFAALTPAAAFAAGNDKAEAANSAARMMEAEQLLASLGYWVNKVDGSSDASTKHAIAAFQKVEGLKRTGVLNNDVLTRLRGAARPVAKYAGAAHVEIDISRQVLYLVGDDGQVSHVLPVSTGSGERYFSEGKWQTANTPRGKFKITRQIKNVRKAPLGMIYYPNYFHEGWAIHGSNSIPVKPASHGCARIPRFADKQFSSMVRVGMAVYVYD